MKDRFHDDALAEMLIKDSTLAVDFLNDVLANGDQAELLVALRQLSKAHGGMARVAQLAELDPTQLYRALSPEGNPELRSLTAILRAMGMRLAVERLYPSAFTYDVERSSGSRATALNRRRGEAPSM